MILPVDGKTFLAITQTRIQVCHYDDEDDDDDVILRSIILLSLPSISLMAG